MCVLNVAITILHFSTLLHFVFSPVLFNDRSQHRAQLHPRDAGHQLLRDHVSGEPQRQRQLPGHHRRPDEHHQGIYKKNPETQRSQVIGHLASCSILSILVNVVLNMLNIFSTPHPL